MSCIKKWQTNLSRSPSNYNHFQEYSNEKENKDVRTPSVKMWNTNREGGLSDHKFLTNGNRVFCDIATNEKLHDNSEKILKVIEREWTNVKHKSFGKVKYRQDKKLALIKLC